MAPPKDPDAPAPGSTKTIDAQFIRDLGKNIATAADESIPDAKNLASQAQSEMLTAGQAGGLVACIGFLLAAEYAEHAWETKQQTADDFKTGLDKVAQNWEDVEQLNTVN